MKGESIMPGYLYKAQWGTLYIGAVFDPLTTPQCGFLSLETGRVVELSNGTKARLRHLGPVLDHMAISSSSPAVGEVWGDDGGHPWLVLTPYSIRDLQGNATLSIEYFLGHNKEARLLASTFSAWIEGEREAWIEQEQEGGD